MRKSGPLGVNPRFVGAGFVHEARRLWWAAA
jgi:hypothetical protein